MEIKKKHTCLLNDKFYMYIQKLHQKKKKIDWYLVCIQVSLLMTLIKSSIEYSEKVYKIKGYLSITCPIDEKINGVQHHWYQFL